MTHQIVLTIDGSESHYTISDDEAGNALAKRVMKCFHEAKQNGSTATLETARPNERQVQASERGNAYQTAGLDQVSEVAKERIAKDEAVLRAYGEGLVPPPASTVHGHVVNETALNNLRISRRNWEDTPLVVEGLRDLWHRIKAEERTNVTVDMGNLKFLDDGNVDWGDGPIALERGGLAGLIKYNKALFPRALPYLRDACDPEMRAYNWNNKRAAMRGRELSVRVRTHEGQRRVFAVTGVDYPHGDHDVVTIMGHALKGKGMRGTVWYSPETTNIKVTATHHVDNVVDFASGDIFKIAHVLRSNDAAKGGITGDLAAYRPECLNFSIITSGKTRLFNVTHQGTREKMLEDVRAGIKLGDPLFERFLSRVGVLRSTPIEALFAGPTTKEVMEEFALMGPLKALPVKRDTLVEQLLLGYNREPGGTLADLYNAVTAVHFLEEVSEFNRERYEEAAGVLVPILAKRAAEA